jgi:hypothetical protein
VKRDAKEKLDTAKEQKVDPQVFALLRVSRAFVSLSGYVGSLQGTTCCWFPALI